MDGDEIYFDTLVIKFEDRIQADSDDSKLQEQLKQKDGRRDLVGQVDHPVPAAFSATS